MHRRTFAIVLSVAVVVGACGSDRDTSTPTTADGGLTTTTAAVAPLTILVTDDDGIGAPGIDVLVTALQDLDEVEVVVVAPAANQSGSSDTMTPGGAPYEAGATASGVEGTAVDGFPADTIAVALDELGIDPDLVVSGINEGQNSGPLAYVSGTVGAAREAVRRGIPAIAGSAGLGEDADYQGAADLVVEWITEHRDATGYPVETVDEAMVVSFNVPDCTAGTMRELVEAPLATVIPEGVNPFESDCSVEISAYPADDVAAVVAGHASVAYVPVEAPPS